MQVQQQPVGMLAQFYTSQFDATLIVFIEVAFKAEKNISYALLYGYLRILWF